MSYYCFPATGGRPELSRTVDPSEIVHDDPRLKWSCRACRNGIQRFDLRHTRDPDGCKYPLIEEQRYECEGCLKRVGRTSPLHNFQPGQCRFADPELRGRQGGRQGGVHEPRAPASSAPGADLRDLPRRGEDDDMPQEAPDTGGAEPLRPPPRTGPAAVPGDEGDDEHDDHAPERRGRPPDPTREAGTQADEGPDWTKWDLGSAIRGLRSASRVIRARTLRRLHVRLWHAPAKRMRDLLQAAGLGPDVLREVQSIVDTCRSCREWARRTNKSVVSVSLTSSFNEGIQFDLLFLDDGIVVHLIDLCIRWAQGIFVASREPRDVLPAIEHIWFRVYGVPGYIVSDQEGALFSDEGADWADRWVTDLRSKPKGAHAHVTERRNEMLRQQYHRLRSQAHNEGLNVTKQQLLDESLLACNTVLSVHGVSPYEALFGRQPRLLRDLHGTTGTILDDFSGGHLSRHVHRLRELSLQQIIQGHAEERLKVADRSKARPATQTLGLKPGDLV